MTQEQKTTIIEMLKSRRDELVYKLRSNEKNRPLSCLSDAHNLIRADIKEIDSQIATFQAQ
jgi:hypothetical protein